MSIVKPFLAYKLIELLSKPFKEWEAFKHGIIDDNGKILKKVLKTRDEKVSYGFFEKIIRKIKVIMNRFIGQSKIAAVLSTLYLIRDDVAIDFLLKHLSRIDEDFAHWRKQQMSLEEKFKSMLEEKAGEVIKKGKYKFIIDEPDGDFKEGDKFELKQDLSPIKTVGGVDIYEIELKKKKIHFAKIMIKKA